MTTTPYIEINGLVLTPSAAGPEGLHVTHSGCVTPSGGGIKVDEYNYPWRDYAAALHSGRQLRKYRVEVASFTRSDVDEFCDYVNNAPIDSEFYPESSDRCCYVQVAHAVATKPALAAHPITGAWTWRYKAKAEIVVRGAWTYGPDQGIDYVEDVDLWQATSQLTNNGAVPAGLDYLLVSGDYDGDYVEDLAVNTYLSSYTELQGYILLCEKMMRNDRLEFNRWGEVNHQYSKSTFDMTYANLQIDFQGSTYCSGGSIADSKLTVGNSGKLIFPFWGPLPVAQAPYIEVWVTAITGDPVVQCGVESDLSDLAGWEGPLQLGYNKIYCPYMIGETDIFFGVVCDADDSITISSVTGFVQRYVAPSSLYLIDPGDSFYIAVMCGAACVDVQEFEVCYRDVFYY